MALARQMSELDAVTALLSGRPASAIDAVPSAPASAMHTPRDVKTIVVDAETRAVRSPGALRVRTRMTEDERDAGDERASGEATTFAELLEEEIARGCHTPATTAGVMPLHAAVARGDARSVREMLPQWTPRAEAGNASPQWPPSTAPLESIGDLGEIKARRVDQRNERGDTALAVACALEDSDVASEMVQILLDAGADPRAASSNGFAPVHWACQFGHVRAVEFMISASKGIGCLRSDDGSTPALVAADYGHMTVLRALIDSGEVNPMARDARGRDIAAALGSKMRRQSQTAKLELRTELFRLFPSLRLAFLSHPDCSEHVSFRPHQESPERIIAIFDEVRRAVQRGDLVQEELEETSDFDTAEPHDILRAHSERYVRVLAKLSDQVGNTPIAFTPFCQDQNGVPEKMRKSVDASDTFFSPGTLQAALRAAGGVMHAVDRVIDGRNRSAFVCCRPPGHHAGTDGATEGAPSSGFSILNNAMIGALHAIESRKCMRVAVIDFDVHHGNGTEEIARHWLTKQRAREDYHRHRSPDLFFASIHLADDGSSSGINFYPGTGLGDDMVNNIVNVVVPPMWLAKGANVSANAETGERARKRTKRYSDSDEDRSAVAKNASQTETPAAQQQGGRLEWMKLYRERLIPALRAFGPELIIVSAGFDAAASDVGNLGVDSKRNLRHQGINLRPEDYADMTRALVGVANVCDGRVVSVLEGGYGHLMSMNVAKDGSVAEVQLGRDVFAKCVAAHVKALLVA